MQAVAGCCGALQRIEAVTSGIITIEHVKSGSSDARASIRLRRRRRDPPEWRGPGGGGRTSSQARVVTTTSTLSVRVLRDRKTAPQDSRAFSYHSSGRSLLHHLRRREEKPLLRSATLEMMRRGHARQRRHLLDATEKLQPVIWAALNVQRDQGPTAAALRGPARLRQRRRAAR